MQITHLVARIFADYQAAQVGRQYRLKEVYAEQMAHGLAKKFETDLFGLATAANISRVVNASTAGIKSSDLESAIGIIESYNVPREECMFFLKPKAYRKMRLLLETVIRKFRKLRGNLYETIRSETQKWGRSTTIIGVPLGVMG